MFSKTCRENCKCCHKQPYMISHHKWCYDDFFLLPTLIEGPERFAHQDVINLPNAETEKIDRRLM